MKGRSILEAVSVFTIFMVVTAMIPGVKGLIRWETRNLGGSFFTGVLIVVLTLVASIVSKLDFKEIGLDLSNWRRSLNMGFKGYLMFLFPQLIMTYLSSWGLDYREYWQVALIQGAFVLIFTFLLVRNIGKKRGDISRLSLILIAVILGTPLVIGFVYEMLSRKILFSFIWQILVGGFSEELLYRGYIQSTVNREYGTNWKVKGINFGPGLIVSSILYGLSRGLRTYNFGWGIYALTLGLFYGLIREASGDIIGSGSANALIDGCGAILIKILK